jgi:hypothetical protein
VRVKAYRKECAVGVCPDHKSLFAALFGKKRYGIIALSLREQRVENSS